MLDKWQAWKDFQTPPDWYTEEEAKVHKQTADAVLADYSPAQLEKSWRWVLQELETLKMESVPELSFADIRQGKVDEETVKRLKKAGCFVVRSVVDQSEAGALNDSLQTFLSEHKDSITGWPVEAPHIKQLYWTEAQVKLRAHPNHLLLQEWLNKLWVPNSQLTEHESLTTPLTYADALRSMPHNSTYPALGPHVDAGSLSRWLDVDYRHFYDAVFSGNPENLDLYRLKDRASCKQHIIEGPAHSTVLRTFQGWTCLTDVGEQKGGIWFYPRVNLAITYILLRPFFQPIRSEEEIRGVSHADSAHSGDGLPTPTTTPTTPELASKELADSAADSSANSASHDAYLAASNWKFVPPTYFQGAQSTISQLLGNKSHPHLQFSKRMVSIPDLHPGDSVWWHCDGIHAVEPNHFSTDSTDPAVVVYVPSVPSTPGNIEYVKKQAETYKQKQCPPDFAQIHTETHAFDPEWVKGGEAAMLI